MGDTAKQLSERFGKIVQINESVSINRTDTSVSKSGQLDFAVPASKIAGLSSGEFVGMVADDPDQPIKLKTFHSAVINDHMQLKKEQSTLEEIPTVRTISSAELTANFFHIKKILKTLLKRNWRYL